MTFSRVATVKPVSPEDASPRVSAVYTDLMATKGIDFVPRFWQVIATNPVQLESVWAQVKALMHPEADGHTAELDAVTREMIAVAVSATNGCSYCINSHTAVLHKLGASPAAISEMLAIVGLFIMTNALSDGYQIEPDVYPPLASE